MFTHSGNSINDQPVLEQGISPVFIAGLLNHAGSWTCMPDLPRMTLDSTTNCHHLLNKSREVEYFIPSC